MTGVLNAMVGAGGGQRYTITVANNAGTTYGYNDSASPSGSISPSATLRGVTIRGITSNASPGQLFTVALNGTLAQTFFAGIEVQRTDGAIQMFFTNDPFIIFDNGGGFTTLWSWNNSPSYAWTATGSRLIRIF